MVVSWQSSYHSRIIASRHAVSYPPLLSSSYTDRMMWSDCPSDQLKRGKGGSAAANPNRSGSVWVIVRQDVCWFDSVTVCHRKKVWIIRLNLNAVHMAGWQSNYLQGCYCGLLILTAPPSSAVLVCRRDCLLLIGSDKAFHVAPCDELNVNETQYHNVDRGVCS